MSTVEKAAGRVWDTRRTAKRERLTAAGPHTHAKVIDPNALALVLEAVIRPGDKVALEGDNQKQADFLSRTLAACDPRKLHDLHMLIGSVSRAEHLDLFEQGIAGVTPLGRSAEAADLERLRRDGLVALPSDLKVDTSLADRSLLAARSIGDLVAWSGGLYEPPAKFRNW